MPFARSSRAASPVPEVPPSPAAPGHTQAPSLSIAPLKGQVTPCSSRRYSVLTHGSPCTPFGVDLRPKGVKRVAYWMTVMDEPGKTRNWDDDFQVITYDDKNDVTVRAPRRPHFGSVSSLWAAAIPGTVFQEPKPASVSPPVGSITRSLAQSGVSSTRTQRRRRARAVLDDRPRPFRCVECSARFGMRGHLSQHERYVHSGHRPHKCTWAGCDVSFGTIFAKKQHVWTVHEGLKPFQCPTPGCASKFGQRSHLTRHMKKCRTDATPSPTVSVDRESGMSSNGN